MSDIRLIVIQYWNYEGLGGPSILLSSQKGLYCGDHSGSKPNTGLKKEKKLGLMYVIRSGQNDTHPVLSR